MKGLVRGLMKYTIPKTENDGEEERDLYVLKPNPELWGYLRSSSQNPGECLTSSSLCHVCLSHSTFW